MVGNQIDNYFETTSMQPVDESFELVYSSGRVVGVVGTDIEVIADGVERAGSTLNNIRVIERQPRIGRERGLPQTSCEPDVRNTKLIQCRDSNCVDIGELPTAVNSDFRAPPVGEIYAQNIGRQAGTQPAFVPQCSSSLFRYPKWFVDVRMGDRLIAADVYPVRAFSTLVALGRKSGSLRAARAIASCVHPEWSSTLYFAP